MSMPTPTLSFDLRSLAKATAKQQATPEEPWLGLAHFTSADKEYFFGRSAEIRDLTDRVRRAPLTVLYGVSGHGKSSLIGAGLIPELEKAGLQHIVLLRRCYDDLAERSLVDDVLAVVSASDSKLISSRSLWEFYHDRRQPWFHLNDSREISAPPVLILDQFEEIFTKGVDRNTEDSTTDAETFARASASDAHARANAEQFLEQLSDLVENRPPSVLREELSTGTPEAKKALLAQFDFQARPARVLLALREDLLGRLERLRRQMPSIMEHRIELRLLAGPQAFQAVFNPGTKREGKQPIIPRDVAEAIVCAAAGVRVGTDINTIDAVPPILSLLCERMNALRTSESITTDDFSADTARNILAIFYEEKLGKHPRRLREFIELKLSSDTGLRETISLEAALTALRSVPDARKRLFELVDDRVLVIEVRGGKARVEFTHDELARIAMQKRSDREARRKLLWTVLWVLVVAGTSWAFALWALGKGRAADAMNYQLTATNEQLKEANLRIEQTMAQVKSEKATAQKAAQDSKERLQQIERMNGIVESTSRLVDELSRIIEGGKIDPKEGGNKLILQASSIHVTGFEGLQDGTQLEILSRGLRIKAQALEKLNDLKGAENAFKEAQIIAEKWQAIEPNNLRASRALSLIFRSIGQFELSRKNFDGAAKAGEQALAIRGQAGRDPSDSDMQHDISVGYGIMGAINFSKADLVAAELAYEEANRIIARLVEQDKNPEWQRELAISFRNLATVKQNAGQAEESLNKSLELMIELTKSHAERGEWQDDLWAIYKDLAGIKKRGQGDPFAAEELLLKANAIVAGRSNRDPNNVGLQRNLYLTLKELGEVYEDQMNKDSANRRPRFGIITDSQAYSFVRQKAEEYTALALGVLEKLERDGKLNKEDQGNLDSLREALQRIRSLPGR